MNTNEPQVYSWTKLGLGTGTLASLGRAASKAQVNEIISVMLDVNINVIDTADTYGSGDCELLLGRSLRDSRDSFRIVTKAGYRLSNLQGPFRPLNQFLKKGMQRIGMRQCFAPEYLSSSLDHSLKRLKTDRVDAFLLHDPPLEAVKSTEVIDTCVNLKNAGKAVKIGVSSGNTEILEAAIATGVFEIVQTPASIRFASVLRPIWERCHAHGIHVIANHVFDPVCLNQTGANYEKLMRASSALLPKATTILCGTRNSSHLLESNQWAHDPLPICELEKMIKHSDATV